jgi:hypothetical protein
MTPQEKAIELYEKYDSLFKAPYKKHKDTKLCALIAVDEILKSVSVNKVLYLTDMTYQIYTYWSKVKDEIEKL